MAEAVFRVVPAAPPKVTLVSLVKPLAVTVTVVPPCSGPEPGETLVTTGAGV